MKQEIISQLHNNFEIAVNKGDGVEYWFARDLQRKVRAGDKKLLKETEKLKKK
jgi:hypothetical protein